MCTPPSSPFSERLWLDGTPQKVIVRTSNLSMFSLRASSERITQIPQSQYTIPSVKYFIPWGHCFFFGERGTHWEDTSRPMALDLVWNASVECCMRRWKKRAARWASRMKGRLKTTTHAVNSATTTSLLTRSLAVGLASEKSEGNGWAQFEACDMSRRVHLFRFLADWRVRRVTLHFSYQCIFWWSTNCMHKSSNFPRLVECLHVEHLENHEKIHFGSCSHLLCNKFPFALVSNLANTFDIT